MADEIESISVGAESFKPEHLYVVNPTTKVSDTILAIGSCSKVLCVLKPEIVQPKAKLDAFSIMMTKATKLVLPEKRPEHEGRASIFNRLVEYMGKQNVGFRVFEKNEMDYFMSTLVSVLWQIDGQWDKFKAACNVPALPENLYFVPEGRKNYRVTAANQM